MRNKQEMLRDYNIKEDGTIWLNGKQLGSRYKDGTIRVGSIGAHTLVAEKYLERPEGAVTIKHKDGDKTNNAVSNLEWGIPRKIDYNDYFVTKDGKHAYNNKTGKELTLSVDSATRYVHTGHALLHRLVAMQYVPNPDPTTYITVNHKDGNKQNNHADNLEWVSYSQNSKHATDTNLNKIPKGCNSHHTKFKRDDLVDIINRYGKYEELQTIAKSYNVAVTTIANILSGLKFQSENLDYSPVLNRRKKAPFAKLAQHTCKELQTMIKTIGNKSKVARQLGVRYDDLHNYLKKHCLSVE